MHTEQEMENHKLKLLWHIPSAFSQVPLLVLQLLQIHSFCNEVDDYVSIVVQLDLS